MKLGKHELIVLASLLLGAFSGYGDPTTSYIKLGINSGPNGARVSNPLIEGSDHVLYGSCYELFKINRDGTGYVAFTNGWGPTLIYSGPSHYCSPLEGSDGKLYFVLGANNRTLGETDVGHLARINKDDTGFED